MRVLFVAALLVLQGCDIGIPEAKPIPTEYTDLVGVWDGGDIHVVITAEGSFEYKSTTGSGSYSMTLPLTAIDHNHLEANWWFFHNEYKIDKPPYVENGVTKLKLDGQVLEKTADAPPAPSNTPEPLESPEPLENPAPATGSTSA